MPIHGYPGNVITANPTAPTSSVATGVWTTEQQLIAKAAGNWPMGLTQISRSLRFNSADSAYLNRTPGSAGNRKTWTWNGWVKRSGSGSRLFCSGDQGVSLLRSFLLFGDNISFIDVNASNTTLAYADSVAVFRDYSAWYCVTLVIDTTQATGSNRVKLYVNGVQQTLTFSTTPSQNADLAMNAASRMTLGTAYDTSSFLDCYLTEVNFIDGLALDPSYFGFNNSDTGVWSPKQYTGTYGTNGFYLNFSDNSGTTSTTLGKDYSGNGNNWTPNNFSVTAGAGNDSLVDVPTSYGSDTGAGGEVRGNYCTLNPLQTTQSASAPTNGNLTSPANAGVWRRIGATIQLPTTGKWYFEYNCDSFGTFATFSIGVFSGNIDTSNNAIGFSATEWGYNAQSGYASNNNTNISSGFTTATTGDVLQLAYDASTGSLWFGKNNTWQGASSPNPSTGTSPTYTGVYNVSPVMVQNWATQSVNFGQRAFAYAAPSNFKALCTQNLPTPTIGATSTTQANDYFNAVLYTGDDTNRTIDCGLQTDFIWTKGRNAAVGNRVSDSVRGASGGLMYNLVTNLTSAENTDTAVTGIVSNGFTLTGGNHPNNTGTTYVAWGWKANGAGGSNTAGSITSTVSANTTSGFSIVTWTNPGSTQNITVGHGLGVAPSMIIVKQRNVATASWPVWHIGLTGGASNSTYRLYLDLTNAQATASNVWGSAAPTSSVFGVGVGVQCDPSANMVAYCFAPVAGYSAFGSYTGNGSTDGPFVYLGFRPRFVMFKNISSTSSWLIIDTQRSPYNQAVAGLLPNSTNAETGAGTGAYDFLSNGFKPRNVATNETNVNGNIYIYAAFAESPFKYALAR